MITRVYLISLKTFWVIHLRRPLVGWRKVLILRCFGKGGGGGVPLIYDVTNKKINCNRKQLKEMKLKKRKCKSERNR